MYTGQPNDLFQECGEITLEKTTKSVAMVPKTYPTWLWYVGLCINTLWLNSHFDIRSAMDKARHTRHGVSTSRSDTATGKAVPSGWKTSSTHFSHVKIGGVTDGWFLVEWANQICDKPINFILPPAIQRTLHQILSSRNFIKTMVTMVKKEEKAIPPTPELSINVGRVNQIHDECVLDALINQENPGKVLAVAGLFLGSDPTQTCTTPTREDQQNSPPLSGVIKVIDHKAGFDAETLKAKAEDQPTLLRTRLRSQTMLGYPNICGPGRLWSFSKLGDLLQFKRAFRKLQAFCLVLWKQKVCRDFTKGFHLHGKLSGSAREIERDGLQACAKADNCSWWNWDKGSSIFFWRWPLDYQETARVGLKPMFNGPVPSNADRQSPYSDPSTKALLADLKFVEAMMFMLHVPKGETDVCIIYDGIKSGLNDALYAPWLALPPWTPFIMCYGAWHPHCFKQAPGDQFPVLLQCDLDNCLIDNEKMKYEDTQRFKNPASTWKPETVHDGKNCIELTHYFDFQAQLGMEFLVSVTPGSDPARELLRSQDEGRNALCVQFETVRRYHSAFTHLLHTCPDEAGAHITLQGRGSGFVSTSVANSLWFKCFTTGCHCRMGDVWLPDVWVTLEIMDAALDYMEEEQMAMDHTPSHKIFDFVSCAVMFLSGFYGGLRGEEVCRISLSGIIHYWDQSTNKDDKENGTCCVPLTLTGTCKNQSSLMFFTHPLTPVIRKGGNILKWFKRMRVYGEMMGISTKPLFMNKERDWCATIADLDGPFHDIMKVVQCCPLEEARHQLLRTQGWKPPPSAQTTIGDPKQAPTEPDPKEGCMGSPNCPTQTLGGWWATSSSSTRHHKRPFKILMTAYGGVRARTNPHRCDLTLLIFELNMYTGCYPTGSTGGKEG
eukprot:jgi/Psemu1/1377/gm1.1377_g